MDLEAVREELEGRASAMIAEAKLIHDADVYVGSRQVEFNEVDGAVWDFGITVSLPTGYEKSLRDFDALMTGPHQLKGAIEEDRSLGGLVMDVDVKAIKGPQRSRSDELTVVEWIVKIRAEE